MTDDTAETGRQVAVVKKAALTVGEEGYIVPTTIEEAYRMAVAIVEGGLAPDSYNRDPQKVMLGLMAAMEAGLQPMYGLRQIAIINGRPTIWGDAGMALIQRANLLERQEVVPLTDPAAADDFEDAFNPDSTPVSEWPDWYGFEVRMFRRGQETPYVGRYTVGMAKRAKLWMNPRKVPWMEHPQRMLLIRARAFPQRDGFADALAGLSIREEVEDHYDPDKTVELTLTAQPVDAPPLPEEENV